MRLTAEELGKLVGMRKDNIATYRVRKKIVQGKDKLYDTENELNKAFIEKFTALRAVQAEAKQGGDDDEVAVIAAPVAGKRNGVKKAVSSAKGGEQEGEDDEEEDIMSVAESERMYQHARALKTQKGKELLEIQIAKAKGDVIPVGPIEGMFFRYKQTVLTQVAQVHEAVLNELAHKYDMPGADIAYTRGVYKERLNEAMRRANDLFLNELGRMLSDTE